MNITCDKCKCEFELSAVEIYEAQVCANGDNLTLQFFVCPKCYELYRVALVDAKCRELQNALDRTKQKIRIFCKAKTENVKQAKKLDKEVKNRQKALKTYMDQLNNKYQGTFTFAASENNCKDVKIVYHENK